MSFVLLISRNFSDYPFITKFPLLSRFCEGWTLLYFSWFGFYNSGRWLLLISWMLCQMTFGSSTNSAVRYCIFVTAVCSSEHGSSTGYHFEVHYVIYDSVVALLHPPKWLPPNLPEAASPSPTASRMLSTQPCSQNVGNNPMFKTMSSIFVTILKLLIALDSGWAIIHSCVLGLELPPTRIRPSLCPRQRPPEHQPCVSTWWGILVFIS